MQTNPKRLTKNRFYSKSEYPSLLFANNITDVTRRMRIRAARAALHGTTDHSRFLGKLRVVKTRLFRYLAILFKRFTPFKRYVPKKLNDLQHVLQRWLMNPSFPRRNGLFPHSDSVRHPFGLPESSSGQVSQIESSLTNVIADSFELCWKSA